MTDLADNADENRIVVDFDHHSLAFTENPWAEYDRVRSVCPVAYTHAHDGFWVITGDSAVRELGRNESLICGQGATIPPNPPQFYHSIPHELDPPMHTAYRSLLNPLFTSAAVERMMPLIRRVVREAIDSFIEKGECDIIHDFADQVPAIVTLELLGLPSGEWQEYAEPLHIAAFLRHDNPRYKEVVGWERKKDDIRTAILDRMQAPKDDLISTLTRAEVNGERLELEVIESIVQQVLLGGFDTTGSAIGNALLYLDFDRAARRALIEQPERIPAAIEEFLRYEAPSQHGGRTATADIEIAGQVIRKGERVFLGWAAANRDPALAEDPGDFRLDRKTIRNWVFGYGRHRCLGSHLARQELNVALTEFLGRIPDYEIDRDNVERAEMVGTVLGLFALPTRFSVTDSKIRGKDGER